MAVVHVAGPIEAVQQSKTAFDSGTDEVSLINHSAGNNPIMYTDITEIAKMVRSAFPNDWIGTNYLDLHPYQAYKELPAEADGLWTDQLRNLEPLSNGRLQFGGVGFKHQKQLVTLDDGVRNAIPITDVLTTSGVATGVPANVSKVELIRSIAGPQKLIGLASGVTIENISLYLPLINCFLIATGISKTFTEFDPLKVREIADAISDFKK